MVRQIAYIHGRESMLLEIEKGNNTNTWRRRITSLSQLPALTCCCPWQQLLFLFSSPHILCTHSSLTFCSLSRCPFIGSNGATSSSSSSTMVAANLWHLGMVAHGWCNSSCSCCNCQWLLHINGNQPNNHPLCHSCGATVRLLLQHRLASCSSSKLTILRASLAFREHLWPSLQVLAKPFNHQSHRSTPFLTQKDYYNQMVCHITSEEC